MRHILQRFPLVGHLSLFLLLLGAATTHAQTDQIDIFGVGSVTWTDQTTSTQGTASRPAFGTTTGDLNPGSGGFLFEATPQSGWAFARWEIPLQSFTSILAIDEFFISGSEQVLAYFHPELNVQVVGSGVVNLNPGSDITEAFPCESAGAQVCTEAFNNEVTNVLTLEAVPAPGFTFVGWTGGATTCSTNPICTLTASGDGGTDILPQSLVAVFESAVTDSDGDGLPDIEDDCPNSPTGVPVDAAGCADSEVFQLTGEFLGTGSGALIDVEFNEVACTSDDPTCAARVSGTAPIIIAAEAAPGSVFVGWGGLCAGTTGLQCQFDPVLGGSGTVSVTFDLATGVDTDNDGVADTIDECPTSPTAVVVDNVGCADSEVMQVTGTFLGTGNGAIRDVIDDIVVCTSDGPECFERVNGTAPVVIAAEAAPGSVFVGWGGLCAGTTGLQCQFDPVLGSSGTVSVTFDLETAADPDSDNDGIPDSVDDCPTSPTAVTVDGAGCADSEVMQVTGEFLGTGSGLVRDVEFPDDFCSSEDAECFRRISGTAPVILAAEAAPGSVFVGWGGLCAGTTGLQCQFDPVLGGSGTVSVTFDLAPTSFGAVNVALSGQGSGRVESSAIGINCPGVCSGNFASASDQVTLIAVADAGSVFAGWSGDGCDSINGQECVVAASPDGFDRNVTAIFEPEAADTLTVVVEGSGSVTDTLLGIDCPAVRCSAAWPVSATNTVLTATPAPGFTFVGWSGGNCPTSGTTCTVEKATVTVTATFAGDTDGDGVLDADDLCPNTPTGEAVDADGCAPSEKDSDSDGVTDDIDECPDTAPGATVDEVGCSGADEEIADFGEDLGELEGLTETEAEVAVEIDNTCSTLIRADEDGNLPLTDDQQDLRTACSNLKNQNSTPEEQAEALRVITPEEEIGAQVDYIVNLANAQNQHITNRLNMVNAGGGRGVSISGLNLNIGGQMIPGSVIENTLKEILAGSSDSFDDFGNLGIFLQGDLDFGERDSDGSNTGYEFDSWSLTAGADYRFTDTFFAGASISLGGVEVDTGDRLGSTDVDNLRFTTYAGWQVSDNFFIDGQLAYTMADYSLSRTVSYTDSGGLFNSVYLGDTEGDQWSAGLNMGYMLNHEGWRFGPTATVSYIDGTIDGYRERARQGDSAAWAFAITDQDYSLLRTTLGLQVDYAIATDFGVLLPGFRASYVYEDEDANALVPLTFVNNPFGLGDGNQILIRKPTRDTRYFDSAFNLSGQFAYGISAYMSYRFYSAFSGYSQTGYTLGVRWDKAF